MKRNESIFWYMLYDSKVPILDEYGNETGEYEIKYAPAVQMKASVSAAFGTSQVEQFGTHEGYDKVILTCDLACPIAENTVLFLDKVPEYTEDETPLYDYVVKRVARSINGLAYAVSKVRVS